MENTAYSTRMYLCTPADYALISKLKNGELPQQEQQQQQQKPEQEPPSPPSLLPSEQQTTGAGQNKGSPDTDLVRFYQKMISDRETKKMIENKQWKNLYKKLEPLFSMRATIPTTQQQQQQQQPPQPPSQQQQQHPSIAYEHLLPPFSTPDIERDRERQISPRKQRRKWDETTSADSSSLAWEHMNDDETDDELPSSFFKLTPGIQRNVALSSLRKLKKKEAEEEEAQANESENPLLEAMKKKLEGYLDETSPKKTPKRNLKKPRLEVSPILDPSPFGPGQGTRASKKNRRESEEKKKKGNGKKIFKWSKF